MKHRRRSSAHEREKEKERKKYSVASRRVYNVTIIFRSALFTSGRNFLGLLFREIRGPLLRRCTEGTSERTQKCVNINSFQKYETESTIFLYPRRSGISSVQRLPRSLLASLLDLRGINYFSNKFLSSKFLPRDSSPYLRFELVDRHV